MVVQEAALDPSVLIPRVVGRYTPVHVDRAEGIYVWDKEGRQYMDFTSGIAVTNTGHCHPAVVEAIRDQAGKIIHAQQNILIHDPMLEAAALLTETLPANLNQVFWANSGAEAVEGALKLAKIATHRPAIIAFRGAFHGRTHAAMSVTSSRAKMRGHYEPLLSSVYYAPFPNYFGMRNLGDPDTVDDFCLSELRMLFETMVMPDDVAAILMESAIGEGGYHFPSSRFVQTVREICDQYGILLIMDEIQTGVGRTGKMWGFEHHDLRPDIITVAKGIASGMPVSAVVSDKAIMDKWPPGSHGGTYGGNAVGTAAAAATLKVMRDERLTENSAAMGELLIDGLWEMQGKYPSIGDVRGQGLMVAVEFIHPNGQPNPEAVKDVVSHCLAEDVLLITCGTFDQAIRIIPPLVVNDQEIKTFLTIFEEAVAKSS